MIRESLPWAARVLGAELHGEKCDRIFQGVSTDTRTLKPGELFFCLLGKRDGHLFAEPAAAGGATAIVIDRNHRPLMKKILPQVPVLVVPNTLEALGDLAHAWRNKFSLPVLGITGSNGKTTTKELIRTILSRRFRVLATEGNLNNLIGVPQTLFRLGPEDEIAVIEMGMNDFREIERLTQISRPTLGLITNIGPAHLEKLRGLEGVAQAKGELFAGLAPEATALVNLKDKRVTLLPTPAKKETYGNRESGIWGEILPYPREEPHPLHLKVHMDEEEADLALWLPGRHNLDNILGALAVARHFGISLSQAKNALEHFTPAPSRMEIVPLKNGKKLLDDSYNANPSSTAAALKTLADLKGPQAALAILGEMMELGPFAQKGHQEVGREAGLQKIDYLIAIGSYAEDILAGAKAQGLAAERIRTFRDVEEACQKMGGIPEEVRWILVKGSRANHLERIVAQLKKEN